MNGHALRSIFVSVLGILGGLGAAFLLALLVAVGAGADERGATVALWLLLPGWAGFSYVFLRNRKLKPVLERVLLTLALEAFAFPLAGMAFAALLWIRTFDPVGEQTVVMGQATGLIFGGLAVILGAGLVALAVGGLTFLLFLLLKFNLVHVGRAIGLEAQRRMGEGMVGLLILVAALGVLVAPGVTPAQTIREDAPSTEGTLPGVWTQPFYCPCLRAALFINHAEQGALRSLLRLDRFKDRLLAVFGLGTSREAPALRAARRLLESYVFSTGNPNLRVGELRDLGEEVEGEIVTHSQELVERLRVDKRTGALWAVR